MPATRASTRSAVLCTPRVSSDGQNELTLEEQKAAVLRFAEAAGYDVIASYVEDVEDEEDVD